MSRKPSKKHASGYTFCEPSWATSISMWHIRKLTEKGPKYGGGADTKPLCYPEDREFSGWDLETPITQLDFERPHERICFECLDKAFTTADLKMFPKRWC